MDAIHGDFTHIGSRQVWGGESPFGLHLHDRRQHTYIIGKTGSGKTSLLKKLIIDEVHAGRGVAVVDPHGDLAQELLDLIPPSRTDEVIYFNPADRDHPVAMNLLQNVPVESRPRVASGIVSAFKSIWRDSWGPRLEHILYSAIAALLECQNVSLLGVQRMLVDETYRAWVVRQVRDPMVRSFWVDEFERYNGRFMSEAVSPVQNKIARLLGSPLTTIFGQVANRIDARYIIDHRRIFIANLSKGTLGEDRAGLLGALLVTQFQRAAMERADVPEEERQDFLLAIDEFHSVATDAFASMLADVRKYRLSLAICHQYIDQTTPAVRDAVFGNVGSLLAFRVGEKDAEVLAREFGHVYPPGVFSSLGNYEMCAKILQAGVHGEPFIGRTFPPMFKRYGGAENLIRRSRERYATPRRIVEEKIGRWMGQQPPPARGGHRGLAPRADL